MDIHHKCINNCISKRRTTLYCCINIIFPQSYIELLGGVVLKLGGNNSSVYMDTSIRNKGLLKIKLCHVSTSKGRFRSDSAPSERIYIPIEKVGFSLFHTASMYTVIPITVIPIG